MNERCFVIGITFDDKIIIKKIIKGKESEVTDLKSALCDDGNLLKFDKYETANFYFIRRQLRRQLAKKEE